jgi:hypothetical protein
MNVDFSRVNLQYLIQARDLAREDPALVPVLLGMSSQLAQRLAALTPDELAQVVAIKLPLLVPRQEPWWWQRLFEAAGAGRPGELEAILAHASLIGAAAPDGG